MSDFKNLGVETEILKAIKELGFETPTPIQDKTIPLLLASDQDIVGLAQTGTGKTAAFGLPSVQMTNLKNKHAQTLILCPTRELCLQISKDLISFSKYTKGLGVVAVYGGASMDTQIRALKKESQIVVATPGRAKDLINRKKLVVDKIDRLILDEADEMLTMGFKDELDAILEATPEQKQTLLFSATMSKEVEKISKKYLNNPERISVDKVNLGASNITHQYFMVQAKDRYELLKRIADLNPKIYGIVFCRTRRETKEIANKLMSDGYNADALHGDLSQAQRDEVMGRFRSKHLQVLVATDVAARGIDVNDLSHIINYNLPDEAEVYTHRSGRTGRAGKSGTSIAIIHSRETRRLKEIEKRTGVKFVKELAPSGKDICSKQLYSLIDKIVKVNVDETQIEPFLPAIYEKLQSLDREQLIKHFVSAEFNRFLAYYKNSRDLNVSDKKGDRGDNDDWVNGRKKTKENFTRLFMNVGSKDNLNTQRLIGLINETLDSSSAEIGKIDIMKKFSFFEIDNKFVDLLISGVVGQKFGGIKVAIEVAQENPKKSGRSENRNSGFSGFRGAAKRKKGKQKGPRRKRP